MPTLDTELRQTAWDLVDDLGKSVVFVIPALRQFDISKQRSHGGKPTEITVKVSPPAKYTAEMVDGTIIHMDDVMVGLPALDSTFTPYSGQEVRFDGKKWSIENVLPIYSGDLVALWELQLRG